MAMGPNLPPIQWVPWAVSPQVTWQGCEADNLPPASVEVKAGRVIHPLPTCLPGVLLD
jgi:hypothetical protein